MEKIQQLIQKISFIENKDNSLHKAYLSGLVSEDVIEKSWKKQPIGTVTTRKDGKQYRKISETGDTDKDWQVVNKDKIESGKLEPKGNKGSENKELNNKEYSEEELVEHAKNASESALTNAVKESSDPKVREAANKELERRENEEKPHKENDSKNEDKSKKEDSDKILNFLRESKRIKPSTLKFYQENEDKYEFKVDEDKVWGGYRINIVDKKSGGSSSFPSDINPLEVKEEGKKNYKVSDLIDFKQIGHYNDPNDEYAQDLDENLKEDNIDWKKESSLESLDPNEIKPSEWNNQTKKEGNEKVSKYSKLDPSKMPPIIAVRKKDGKIEAINGIHRVWAAESLGIKVPAIVMTEKLEEALATSDGKMEQFLLSKYKNSKMPEIKNKNESDGKDGSVEDLKKQYEEAMNSNDFEKLNEIGRKLAERANKNKSQEIDQSKYKDDRFTQNFSEEETKALDTYASNKYKEINSQMREGKLSDENKKIVDLILSVMNKNKTKEDVIVYRGQGNDHDKNNKAFTSTSTDEKTANNFARGKDAKVEKIIVPKGTPVAYIGGAERELLLPPNWNEINNENNIKKG